MGLRDIFRGKSEGETENLKQQVDGQESNEAVESYDQKRLGEDQSLEMPSDQLSDNTGVVAVGSVLTTKQRLSKVMDEYNVTRADLQDLLFENQQAIQVDVDRLTPQVERMQERIDETDKSISQIQTELEQASQQASAPFVEKQAELSYKVEENQSQVNVLDTQVTNLGEELSNLHNKQQQLIQAETDISAKFESEKDPAVIVTLADQYRDDIQQNKAERDENATTIAAVEEKQQTLKGQLQIVRDQLTADQKELQDVNAQLEEVQLKIASDDEGRSKQLDTLTQELTKNQNELADLQAELDKKNQELAATNQEINDWLGVPVPVKQLELDEDSEIILDMDGLTDAQFAQLKAAVKVLTNRGLEHFGLYTSQFTLDLNSQIAKWTTDLQIKGGTVSVYNPLYSLQHQGKLGAKYQLPDNAVSDEWNDAHTERTLVLDNGWTLKVHYFEGSDTVATVDSYQGDHLAESSTLTTGGQLTANRFFNDDGTKNRDEYYSQSGLGVLNVRYEQDELSTVELLNAVGMQVQTFATIAGFTEWWMKNSFNHRGLLMGAIENQQYRHLLGETQGEPITLVTASSLEQDEFKAWAMALPKQQYLADNYATEMKLIQRLNQPLTISLLDRRNLPVSLGVPAGEE